VNSPFPGIDPYLEARWTDVHVTLVAFLGESLQRVLPRALRARCEERFMFDEGSVPVFDRFVKVIDVSRDDRLVTAINIRVQWVRQRLIDSGEMEVAVAASGSLRSVRDIVPEAVA
jgi:hypothetical protein